MIDPNVKGPVLVTGGGQGLGRAFCLEFGRLGIATVVADIAIDKAFDVAESIVASGGVAVPTQVDVGNEASVQKMVETASAELGPPSVLINNAAIFSTLKMRPYSAIPIDEWDRVLKVNVTGPFLCSRAVLPMMIERGYGKIVNISSASVWIGRPNYLHYVTSKAALIGMTRALASEVGPFGVRVNAITPGSTVTEVERETITESAREEMAGRTALRRVQVPDDLLGTVVFLSSAASDFLTGQTLNVDGGFVYH